MNKKYVLVSIVTILTVVFISLSPLGVLGQYQTQQTADVTVSSTGIAHVDQSLTAGNVAIDIVGTPGATGSVSTATYTANPQPDASIPNNVVLSHFVVVTFNMSSSDFKNATITITYTDADVAGMSSPYVLYKYNPDTNSFIALEGVVDTAAKTITVTLTSTTDPLFAIGGTTVAPTATPTATPDQPATVSLVTYVWIAVAIECVTMIALVVGIVRQERSIRSKMPK